MFKKYIKDIFKTELTTQKLNDLYGSTISYNLNSFSDKEIQQLKQENEQSKEKIKWLQNDKDVLLKQISKQNEENEKLKIYLKKSNDYVKSLEQENKELSSKDFITNDIYIFQLEDAISKIETIGNIVEKLIKENKKLKEKMSIIKGIMHVQHKRTYTNDNLMTTIKLIEDILKES